VNSTGDFNCIHNLPLKLLLTNLIGLECTGDKFPGEYAVFSGKRSIELADSGLRILWGLHNGV